MCSYRRSRDNEINTPRNDSLITHKFNDTINIANSKLPLDTRLKISYNNKTIVAIINDQNTKENETIVELSEVAAFNLDIKQEGTVPCEIKILPPPTKKVKKFTSLIYIVPFFSAISISIYLIFIVFK